MYPQSKFWSKYENSQNNATENFHFYRSEKWLYVASSCFRNDEFQMVVHVFKLNKVPLLLKKTLSINVSSSAAPKLARVQQAVKTAI